MGKSLELEFKTKADNAGSRSVLDDVQRIRAEAKSATSALQAMSDAQRAALNSSNAKGGVDATGGDPGALTRWVAEQNKAADAVRKRVQAEQDYQKTLSEVDGKWGAVTSKIDTATGKIRTMQSALQQLGAGPLADVVGQFASMGESISGSIGTLGRLAGSFGPYGAAAAVGLTLATAGFQYAAAIEKTVASANKLNGHLNEQKQSLDEIIASVSTPQEKETAFDALSSAIDELAAKRVNASREERELITSQIGMLENQRDHLSALTDEQIAAHAANRKNQEESLRKSAEEYAAAGRYAQKLEQERKDAFERLSTTEKLVELQKQLDSQKGGKTARQYRDEAAAANANGEGKASDTLLDRARAIEASEQKIVALKKQQTAEANGQAAAAEQKSNADQDAQSAQYAEVEATKQARKEAERQLQILELQANGRDDLVEKLKQERDELERQNKIRSDANKIYGEGTAEAERYYQRRLMYENQIAAKARETAAAGAGGAASAPRRPLNGVDQFGQKFNQQSDKFRSEFDQSNATRRAGRSDGEIPETSPRNMPLPAAPAASPSADAGAAAAASQAVSSAGSDVTAAVASMSSSIVTALSSIKSKVDELTSQVSNLRTT